MGIGEKLVGFIIALAVGLLGMFIILMTGGSAVRVIPTYQWEKTICHIETGHIAKGGPDSWYEWTMGIMYTYTWEGKEFTSDQFAIQERGYTDPSIAGQVLMRFTPGSVHDCYVNPKEPGEAVLERDPVWLLLMFLGGLVFGIFLTGSGLFLVYRVIRPSR